MVADDMLVSWPTLNVIWMMRIRRLLCGSDRWSGVIESQVDIILRTHTTEKVLSVELQGTVAGFGADQGGGGMESDTRRPIARAVAEIVHERSRGGHDQGGASATAVGRSGL